MEDFDEHLSWIPMTQMQSWSAKQADNWPKKKKKMKTEVETEIQVFPVRKRRAFLLFLCFSNSSWQWHSVNKPYMET
jgi:hypothetical protein